MVYWLLKAQKPFRKCEIGSILSKVIVLNLKKDISIALW
jgi:hypothetical protein